MLRTCKSLLALGLSFKLWRNFRLPPAVIATSIRYSKARSEKESELQRKGRRWLLCAAAAIAAYIVASGQVRGLLRWAGGASKRAVV